jgi:Zn-dependent protease
MSPNVLFAALMQLLLLWLAISVHEAAHAWTAGRLGDPTAQSLGHASLNPLRHLDLLGSGLFPALLLTAGWPLFGWGRPAPVAEGNLRQPYRDSVLVRAAGPLANLLVVGLATFAIMIMVRALGPEARQAATSSLLHQSGAEHLRSFPVMFTLVKLASVNAFVAAFNLIPVPPLDGGQMALVLLPPDWSARLAAVRPYGFIIGVLAAVGLVPLLLLPFYGILGLVINLS